MPKPSKRAKRQGIYTELQADIEAAKEVSAKDGKAAAIRQVGDLVGISEERAATVFASIESETPMLRQRLLHGIAKAWLEGQREARRSHGAGGSRA